MDGLSLTATFAGKKIEREKPLFFQYGGWQAIRENKWKLVQNKGKAWELYDLSEDRTENKNLAAKFPQRVGRMKVKWEKWAKEVGLKMNDQKKKKEPASKK